LQRRHNRSLTISATPGATPPAAPTNLSATVGSNRLVTLRWTDASTNESGFYIEGAAKAKTLAFSRVGQVGANVTTYTFTETAGTWVYRVQGWNATGNVGLLHHHDNESGIGPVRTKTPKHGNTKYFGIPS
jgi:hypothetical protein